MKLSHWDKKIQKACSKWQELHRRRLLYDNGEMLDEMGQLGSRRQIHRESCTEFMVGFIHKKGISEMDLERNREPMESCL